MFVRIVPILVLLRRPRVLGSMEATSIVTRGEPQKLGVGEHGSALNEVNRVNLYRQYFVEHASNTPAPNAFIQQVDGYGVQVFAQASSFAVR